MALTEPAGLDITGLYRTYGPMVLRQAAELSRLSRARRRMRDLVTRRGRPQLGTGR